MRTEEKKYYKIIEDMTFLVIETWAEDINNEGSMVLIDTKKNPINSISKEKLIEELNLNKEKIIKKFNEGRDREIKAIEDNINDLENDTNQISETRRSNVNSRINNSS